MPASSRSALIIGGGPAGMSLAYLLARRGIEVTLLEAHHDFSRAFRGEGMQLSGIDAFRQMGLGAQFDRLPHCEIRTLEMYTGPRLVIRTDSAKLGRAEARLVSQGTILEMLAGEASEFAGFHLERGASARELIRESDRVVGVRATVDGQSREYRADLVIGADGRHAITRKQSGFAEISSAQNYDILWLKVPYTDAFPGRDTAVTEMSPNHVAIVFPTADGRLQVGFVIAKGGFAAMKARGAEVWTEELISRLPPFLADHLRANREAVAAATLLNVVCGRLVDWSAPGLLLIGDAAHPMSPVGGQGVNIALRDALVAANHLCPALTAGADLATIDAAARAVRDERWPEIVAVQKMQEDHGRLLFTPANWRLRLMQRLLPFLVRTGFLQWMNRREFHQMSQGVVPVKLVV